MRSDLVVVGGVDDDEVTEGAKTRRKTRALKLASVSGRVCMRSCRGELRMCRICKH